MATGNASGKLVTMKSAIAVLCETAGCFMLAFLLELTARAGQNGVGRFGLKEDHMCVVYALALMTLVYICKPVSGGHFNPAVSFCVYFAGKCSLYTAVIYSFFQTCGGIVGFLFALQVERSNLKWNNPHMDNMDATKLQPWRGMRLAGEWDVDGQIRNFNSADHPIYDPFLKDGIMMFMLCLVYLQCCYAKASAGNEYFGIAIGAMPMIAATKMGANGCVNLINPALMMARDFMAMWMEDDQAWTENQANAVHMRNRHQFKFWSGAELLVGLCAAGAAALFYRFYFHAEEYYSGLKENRRATCFMAELVGSFLFGTCVVISMTTSVAPQQLGTGTTWTVNPVRTNGLNGSVGNSDFANLNLGLSLMVLVYTFGHVSGAHFNPAVTVSVMCSGMQSIGLHDAVVYMALQTLGMMMGVWLPFYYLYQPGTPNVRDNFPLVNRKLEPTRQFGNDSSVSWFTDISNEFVFTIVLCCVVMALAMSPKKNTVLYGFLIGAAVMVGSSAGACMNPAIQLACDWSYLVTVKADHAHNYFLLTGFPDYFRGWGLLFAMFQLVSASTAAFMYKYSGLEQMEDDEAPTKKRQ